MTIAYVAIALASLAFVAPVPPFVILKAFNRVKLVILLSPKVAILF